MKRTLRSLALAGMLAVLPLAAFSQMSISYYSSSLSKIGLAYDFSPRVWSEMRLYSNTSVGNITPELVLCFNVSRKEFHRVYIGVGGNVNYFTGFVMPIGVQFTPFEKFERFSLHIELEPTLDFSSEDLILQSSWGIRYSFVRRTR